MEIDKTLYANLVHQVKLAIADDMDHKLLETTVKTFCRNSMVLLAELRHIPTDQEVRDE